MSIVDLIIKKRNGKSLDDKEIRFFIKSVEEGSIEDYQISAMLMAIYFRGMDSREIAVMTGEMAKSGDILSFDNVIGPIVDKHSSGGVGDKTSLIIAPIVAANGLPIAKLSGRGLGFTGGTVDKLESIPGFRTELGEDEFKKFVAKDGIAIIGQSANIAPVDKKLYALRDVTGTVDSIPLIAASIMSKKLADGSDSIVLDVKVGSGAFMKTLDEAVELAKIMVGIGEDNGKTTLALVTDMDQPLGSAVGNSLEVIEAIEALKGEGPEDLLEECGQLASAMLIEGGKAENLDEAKKLVDKVIRDGSGLDKFKAMVRNQGGDVSYIENTDKFPKAKFVLEARAKKSAYVTGINAEDIGKSSLILGAGRERTQDRIDHSVGLRIFKKVSDRVEEGELLFKIYANDETKGKEALEKALAAYDFSPNQPEVRKSPVYCFVSKEGVKQAHD